MPPFEVSPVESPAARMTPLPWSNSIARLVGGRVEQMSAAPGDRQLVVANNHHSLAQAAHDAFFGHHPLVLTPDAIWFCLAQGFAHHVHLNGDDLRARLLRSPGTLTLTVEREDFMLGRENPWPEVFTAFSAQLGQHLGTLRDAVVADFSTTDIVARAASEIVLMDAFQGYVKYIVGMGCGIPSISLEGTPDDWRSIRRRVSLFSELGLASWTTLLAPILDELIETSENRVNVDFWRSFFRYDSTSGGGDITGWITVLFPFLKETTWDAGGHEVTTVVPNRFMASWEEGLRAAAKAGGRFWSDPAFGPDLGMLPSSLASAPVASIDRRTGAQAPLRFVAGLFGVAQHDVTRALSPEFAWAIVHEASPDKAA